MSEETAVLVSVEKPDALAPRLGSYELANLPEKEFEQRLAGLKKSQERVRKIKASLMTMDVHYGVIPGTGSKPTLLKPGAELLCSVYGLRPDFEPTVNYGDGETRPDIDVTMRCELHLGDLSGPVVAVGYGMANSWERKHRYRRGERTCPGCGVVGSVIKGKAEFSGGWLCWAKKGGCGEKFKDDAEAIVSQTVGDIENADPHDLSNTLIKMAKKRAFLDATLTGTASSDVFTQDLDEPGRGQASTQEVEPKTRKTQQDETAKPTKREPGSDDGPPSETLTCKFCDALAVDISKNGKTAHCTNCNKGWTL